MQSYTIPGFGPVQVGDRFAFPWLPGGDADNIVEIVGFDRWNMTYKRVDIAGNEHETSHSTFATHYVFFPGSRYIRREGSKP